MRRFILALAALFSAVLLQAAPARQDTLRILAIGNSFSQDAAEQYLWELFDAEEIPVIIGNLYIGGCSLERHWNNAEGDKADYQYRKIVDGVRTSTPGYTLEKGLADEPWDYVSLQQASGQSGLYASYEPYLKDLVKYVKAHVGKQTKLMWHQTWAYSQDAGHRDFPKYDRNQDKMYSAIMNASRKAMKDGRFRILIPSGTAIQNGRTSYLGDTFNRDGYHLERTYGRYTAACAWFETLSGQSVVGNAWHPDTIGPEIAGLCQEAAHAACLAPYRVTELAAYAGPAYKNPLAPEALRVEDLLSRMDLREKVMQLNQYTLGTNDNVNNIGDAVKKLAPELGSVIYFNEDPALRNAMQKKAMEESRLGIPLLFGYDVIHGFKTIYQISLGQACSWNPALVEQMCSLAAREARRSGVDWTFSPMIDVARDPRWGRVSEGYGEDPFANGIFGAASVHGYQGAGLTSLDAVASCLKHYVGYGASEAGRDYVYTEISRPTLWNTYLLPYRMSVEAGTHTLMSSFNDISGVPGSANRYTLTEVLRDMWGFDGLVVSDWNAVAQLIYQGYSADLREASAAALSAGVDMDMMSKGYDKHLEELVDSGEIPMEVVDEAVRRVLRVKFRLGLFENPYTPESAPSERFLLPDALETASELAAQSMVLLKNNGILPLQKVGKIAVVGPLADNGIDLLGNWKAHGNEADADRLLAGITREFAGKAEVRHAVGCDVDGKGDFSEAVALARWSDVVILCLGERYSWSGENTSRTSIALPEGQEALLAALKETGKPVVVTLTNGRPLELCRVEPLCDAILETWQPGVNGAGAAAGILSGRINPSGKLAITFPYVTGQIPIYYNRHKSGRRGTQGLYKDTTSDPLYPFGYGLSYTTFSYGDIRVVGNASLKEPFAVEVPVTNTGARDGMESVLWFVSDPFCSVVTRPEKELKCFEKRLIKAGETEVFRFEIDPLEDLGYMDGDGQQFVESGEFHILVGDKDLKLNLK